MRDDLIDRGILHDSIAIPDREAIDAVMIALIENSYVAAVAIVEAENEDPVCQVDSTKIEIKKPVDGIMDVISSEFKKGDGHQKVRRGQELVIRPSDSHQVSVTLRQG